MNKATYYPMPGEYIVTFKDAHHERSFERDDNGELTGKVKKSWYEVTMEILDGEETGKQTSIILGDSTKAINWWRGQLGKQAGWSVMAFTSMPDIIKWASNCKFRVSTDFEVNADGYPRFTYQFI